MPIPKLSRLNVHGIRTEKQMERLHPIYLLLPLPVSISRAKVRKADERKGMVSIYGYVSIQRRTKERTKEITGNVGQLLWKSKSSPLYPTSLIIIQIIQKS
jgi:hypothetical protein